MDDDTDDEPPLWLSPWPFREPPTWPPPDDED
jgi:hypothetical protein